LSQIQYFNRKNNALETEKVYGDLMIKLLYNSVPGKALAPIFANKFLSKIYGTIQNSHLTQLKVPKFVENFNIDLEEYKPGSLEVENQALSYKNFNEFFIREFREGKREIVADKNLLAAPAEARYFGYDKITPDLTVPVKGKFLTAQGILQNEKWGDTFNNGPLMIARLCPVDYHRYHYPDDGQTLDHYSIHGQFHSVNPLALKSRGDILIANERRVAILETQNFGKLAYVEVGAAMVGKIVQSYPETQSFQKGDEKGYFLFGGSTVILMGEEGRWRPSEDMLENTKKGIETYIKLGDTVGELVSI
jgi:phosphatidylserine decarboxylase